MRLIVTVADEVGCRHRWTRRGRRIAVILATSLRRGHPSPRRPRPDRFSLLAESTTEERDCHVRHSLEPQASDQGHVYIAALDTTGAHVYTRDLHQIALRSIASAGPITAVSALFTGRGPNLIALDSTGQLILPEDGEFPFAARGDAGTVAVDRTGRVYWNFSEAWPTVSAPAYPFLVSLDPGV